MMANELPEQKQSKYPNEKRPSTRTVDAICGIVYTICNYERL